MTVCQQQSSYLLWNIQSLLSCSQEPFVEPYVKPVHYSLYSHPLYPYISLILI